MSLKFKNKTKYSKKVYNDFIKFHTQKYFFRYLIYSFLVIIALIYLMICNILMRNWILMLVIIASIIIFASYRVFSQKNIVDNEMKSEKIKNEEEFEFIFYDEIIVVKKNQEEERIKYRKICKVFENRGYFYLYVNKNDALILNKKGFSYGNVEKFKEFVLKKSKII